MKNILSLILATIPLFLIGQTTFAGESVCYDAIGKRWFTGDDGSSIVQRDSAGGLSYFGTGLGASHGMEIMGNTLFAIDGNTIYGYDLTLETQVMAAPVPGASFLNGLTNNGIDKLYATDFGTDKIHEIDVTSLASPLVTTIVANTVSTPNGIVYDGANNRLVFVSWSASAPVKAVNLTSFAVTTLTTTPLTNIDGIDRDDHGHFFLASWSPDQITQYDTAFALAPVTVSAPGIDNPADIEYARSIDTLGVPNTGNNTITYIGFNPITANDLDFADSLNLNLAPNPVNEQSRVAFYLSKAQRVKLTILDLRGKELNKLIDHQLPNGQNFVLVSPN